MRRWLPWVVGVLGSALVLAGGLLLGTEHPASQVTYSGSYEPLLPQDTAYRSDLTLSFDEGVLWTGRHVTGAVLVVGGLLLLAALGGWAAGRRTARRAPHAS